MNLLHEVILSMILMLKSLNDVFATTISDVDKKVTSNGVLAVNVDVSSVGVKSRLKYAYAELLVLNDFL